MVGVVRSNYREELQMKATFFVPVVAVACGTAAAQTSVVLFGVIDTTFMRGEGSLSSRSQIGNAGMAGNRLGFRGVEDLGRGMAASFWLEAGFNSDDGSGIATNVNNQSTGVAAPQAGGQGIALNRRATVSLAGPWGELRLGRDFVPQYHNLYNEPFYNFGVGASATFTEALGIVGPTLMRASNQVAYHLPASLGGFYGQAAHYLGENASTAPNSDDGSGSGVRLGYANAPFDIAYAIGTTKYAAGDVRVRNLAVSWRFSAAFVQGHMSRVSRGNVDGKGYAVGVTVPLGVNDLKLAYSTHETDAAGHPGVRKFVLGGVHNLSKRTAVYATLGWLRNRGGANAALNGATTRPDGSSRGLDLGVRHLF
jgi:predicted porin